MLESFYKQHDKPSREEIHRIAIIIGVQDKRVQRWFSNHREKSWRIKTLANARIKPRKQILDEYFLVGSGYPNENEITQLIEKLNSSRRKILNWFRLKRFRERKKSNQ